LTSIKKDRRIRGNIPWGGIDRLSKLVGGQLSQAKSTSRGDSTSSRWMFSSAVAEAISPAEGLIAESQSGCHIKVPNYLTVRYWWAYVHPSAVWFFERQWLVNLILWGNHARLRNAAMTESGDVLPGADLTDRLNSRVAAGGGRMDIVDVLPVQLRNLRRKLPPGAPARLLAMNLRRSQPSRRQL
jgi:hypothetical protein